MADEPTTPIQQLMAMMLHLLASFENTRRSLDNRVTEVADRTGNLAKQTSAFSDATETC